MADKTPSQNLAQVLNQFADIEKNLGELSVSFTALHSTLRDLIPEYEARFLEHLASPKCLQGKLEYEQRIRVLLEASRKMSES